MRNGPNLFRLINRAALALAVLVPAWFGLMLNVSPALADACHFTCNDGNTGSPFVADDAACFSTCQSMCSSHGGCYDYVFGNTGTNPTASGSCPYTAANNPNRSTRTAALSGLASQITSADNKGSTWSCQTMSSIDTSRCVSGGCGSTAGLFCCQSGAAAAQPTCAVTALANGATEADLAAKENASHTTRDQWTCQRVCNATDRANKCVTGGCPGGTTVQCCAPSTGIPPGQQCPQAPGGASANQFQLTIACSDLAHGGCTLDDFIQTAVNFANLLLALSGSLYLLIFVYAGVLYVTAGGSGKNVSKAKKILTEATIGMVFILGAHTIIRYVRQSITSSGTGADTCVATKGTLYACQNVSGMSKDDKTAYNCPDGGPALCPGNADFRCCLITPNAAPASTSPTGGTGGTTPTGP